MKKQQIEAIAYQYILIFILLAAIAHRGGRDFLFHKNDVEVIVELKDLQDIYPTATNFNLNRHGIFDVYGKNRKKQGAALLSTNYSQQFGYGGKVPLLIGINDSLSITNIILLPNNETSDYIEAIYGNDFIGRWQGVHLADAIELQVDAVSGATHTSKAVIAGIRHTASSIMKSDASMITETNLWTRIKDISFLGLLLLSIAVAYKKGIAKYRTIYLFLVFIIMGLVLNNALSLQLLHGWLQDGFAWRTNWQSVVVFLFAIIISFVGKRKFYCNYLCPMGALQELTNHFTPIKRRQLPRHLKAYLPGKYTLCLLRALCY